MFRPMPFPDTFTTERTSYRILFRGLGPFLPTIKTYIMLSTTNLNHIFIIKTYWAITFHIKELNPSNLNSTITTHSSITVE